MAANEFNIENYRHKQLRTQLRTAISKAKINFLISVRFLKNLFL